MSLTGHAYLVAGTESALGEVVAHLKKNGIEATGNPDVSIRTYNQFLIDDARELSARASSKALKERRVFIIVASMFTGEAQNALLKTIEEKGIVDAGVFLKSAPGERILMLKPLLDKDEEEKRDIGSILTFLSSLERMLGKAPVKSRQGLEAVYRARKYAGDKGALLKPLLEQVALLVQ